MKIRALIAILAMLACTATPAFASLPNPLSKPLVLRLQRGHARFTCTRHIYAPKPIYIDAVRANGHELFKGHAAARRVWYVGRDTMVRIDDLPGYGPICVRAITWDAHKRVYVKLGWS